MFMHGCRRMTGGQKEYRPESERTQKGTLVNVIPRMAWTTYMHTRGTSVVRAVSLKLTLRYAIARFEKASELFRFMPTHLEENTRKSNAAKRCRNKFGRHKTELLAQLAPRFAFFCLCALCLTPDHSQHSAALTNTDSENPAAMRSQHLPPSSANTHLV